MNHPKTFINRDLLNFIAAFTAWYFCMGQIYKVFFILKPFNPDLAENFAQFLGGMVGSILIILFVMLIFLNLYYSTLNLFGGVVKK